MTASVTPDDVKKLSRPTDGENDMQTLKLLATTHRRLCNNRVSVSIVRKYFWHRLHFLLHQRLRDKKDDFWSWPRQYHTTRCIHGFLNNWGRYVQKNKVWLQRGCHEATLYSDFVSETFCCCKQLSIMMRTQWLHSSKICTILTHSLTFGVGPQELQGFRMIERHYFRDQV